MVGSGSKQRGRGDLRRPSRRVLTYEQALHRAIKVFVRDGGLDMENLAEEIPVSRATLYRVAGNRDRLLGDVLWTLADRTLRMVGAEATGDGLDRIIDTSRRFKAQLLGFSPLRTFLRSEPETAFRILLTPAGRVSERLVESWVQILRRSSETGEITLPFDVEWFAYVFVRIGESMVYSDLLAGREPDLEVAELVQRRLFEDI